MFKINRKDPDAAAIPEVRRSLGARRLSSALRLCVS
jgi:hypothetical protein